MIKAYQLEEIFLIDFFVLKLVVIAVQEFMLVWEFFIQATLINAECYSLFRVGFFS